MATTGVYIDIIGFCVVADAVGNKQIVSQRRGAPRPCADFAAPASVHRRSRRLVLSLRLTPAGLCRQYPAELLFVDRVPFSRCARGGEARGGWRSDPCVAGFLGDSGFRGGSLRPSPTGVQTKAMSRGLACGGSVGGWRGAKQLPTRCAAAPLLFARRWLALSAGAILSAGCRLPLSPACGSLMCGFRGGADALGWEDQRGLLLFRARVPLAASTQALVSQLRDQLGSAPPVPAARVVDSREAFEQSRQEILRWIHSIVSDNSLCSKPEFHDFLRAAANVRIAPRSAASAVADAPRPTRKIALASAALSLRCPCLCAQGRPVEPRLAPRC